MSTRKFGRTALIAVLALSIIMSITGGTIAWFTDEVTSAGNEIKAGNLDIELSYKPGTAEDWATTQWVEVTTNTKLFDEDALYEPGYTEVIPVKIENAGTLALKYQLGIIAGDQVKTLSKLGNEIDLGEYLYFAYVEGAVPADRAAAAANATAKINDFAKAEYADLLPGAESEGYLVLTMPTSIGNEANPAGDAPSIKLGVKLTAIQMPKESDAFGSDYDEDASIPADAVAIAKVNGKKEYYNNLQDAYNAANEAVILLKDVVLTETFVMDKEKEIELNLGGHTISTSDNTLMKITDGKVTLKNGALQNVENAATETKYSIYMSGDAVADIQDVNITTFGTGIYMTENAKITNLDAKVDSFINDNGYCTYDAVSLMDNARIDKISGGEYQSYYTDEFIKKWYESNPKQMQENISYPIRLNSENASIGEISGGAFLGVMDKANNGTPIHVNNGTVELISGGYFGFYKTGLSNPIRLMFVNSGTNASIKMITGGTFEKGSLGTGYGCDFDGIVDASGCKVEETGNTVDVNIQFSTKVTTYTLKVVKVTAK